MPLNTSLEHLYDVRLIKRHLASGKLSKKDVDAYLRSLPDEAANSEVIPREALFDLPHTDSEGESD